MWVSRSVVWRCMRHSGRPSSTRAVRPWWAAARRAQVEAREEGVWMLAPGLADEEKSVVTPDELTVLASHRRRRAALRATRAQWGRKVARQLRQLQQEQLKLARMIAGGEEHLASQRSHVLTLRHAYEASIESIQAVRGPDLPPSYRDTDLRQPGGAAF